MLPCDRNPLWTPPRWPGGKRDPLSIACETPPPRRSPEQRYVSAVEVLRHIGWLQGSWLKDWQLGRLACLEEGMQVDAARLRTALNLLRNWACEKVLRPHEAEYVVRTPQRQTLRFSRSGEPATE